jgi:N-acetylneuraminic acid mutarotase
MAEDSWVSKAQMPTARGFLGVAVVNDKIYAIGGNGPNGANEEYDPATDTWITKSPKPTPEQGFAIAVFQDEIYCIGGLPYGYTGVNEAYDPATDSWETKANMPTARYGLLANVVNGKIYCMGGVRELGYNQGVEQLNVTEVYDPSSNTWTTKAPMPNPAGYVSAVVDNKIYVIGPGLTQIYDPATDSWSTASPSPINITAGGANGIAAAAAATTGTMAPKRIYVYDGSSLQVYDPQKDNWTFGTAPPTSRQYLGIAVVNDLLYFIGGFSYNPPPLDIYTFYATNEQYTPVGYGTLPESTPSQNIEAFLALLIAVVSLSVAIAIICFRKRK